MPTLAARLLATARQSPQRIALVEGARQLDYAALAAQALAFARHLRQAGCRDGDRVAVLLPNCLEAVVAIYGSWLAGCVAVPLNVQARARDFAPWLRHSGAAVLVHEAGNREVDATLPALSPPPLRIVVAPAAADGAVPSVAAIGADDAGQGAVVAWDAALATETGAAAGMPATAAPDAVAAILYTSGTTGAPKGVTLTHANFSANVDAIVQYLALRADDSILTILPFYYSYGASVLHTHLAVGARLVIEQNLVFPHLIVESMARERVSGFAGVPSTYALLLDRVALAEHDLAALRYVTQAGGAMPQALTRRLREALPQARLIVMYGQTEATARLAWLPPERLDDKPGSAGMAIPGVQLQIRDDHGQPLAAGQPGELWARGDNVMAGYWQDPAATAEVLRDGWLRTGDMGLLDAEGYLFLAGRRSDMIKTGAHRVHPLDIEEAVAELPGVVEVAAVGIDDATLGQAIKVVVVLAAGAPQDADRIRAHCRQRLASYKIPRQVEFVSSLPKTASGKIRRALLIAPAALQEAS